MSSRIATTTLSCALIFGITGCVSSAEPEEPFGPDTIGREEATSHRDVARENADTYFAVSADLRKCASPMCGGWFVTRLNRARTRCHDGQYAASCYTPVLDWSAAKLSDAQRDKMLDACRQGAGSGGVYAIARGRFERTNDTTPSPAMGRFVIGEAWVAESGTVSDGLFVKVWDNGLRCFTTPCPSVTETVLNRARSIDIADIDWSGAELTDLQVAACVDRMSTADGLVIAGDRYTVEGTAGIAPARTATAAYYRLTGTAE